MLILWKRVLKLDTFTDGLFRLLCGRFVDSQESRFQALKRSKMGSAVLEVVRSADIHEFCFQADKRSDMDCVELHLGLFDDCQEWHFQVRNVQIRAVPSCMRVDLLMFRKSVYTVQNVDIWAVLCSNEVDLLMLRNLVFRVRIVQNV